MRFSEEAALYTVVGSQIPVSFSLFSPNIFDKKRLSSSYLLKHFEPGLNAFSAGDGGVNRTDDISYREMATIAFTGPNMIEGAISSWIEDYRTEHFLETMLDWSKQVYKKDLLLFPEMIEISSGRSVAVFLKAIRTNCDKNWLKTSRSYSFSSDNDGSHRIPLDQKEASDEENVLETVVTAKPRPC